MRARLVWLLLCGIWGSTWLFIKVGLADLPPLTFAGIRFVIALAILGCFVVIRGLPVPTSRDDWFLLAWTGVLSFTLNYGLVFWGEQYISSGLAAVLQATIPAFGLVMAHFYLPTERMTPAKVVGVILGILGVTIVFSNQLSVAGSKAFAGSVAIVLSALFVAYSNVMIKARARHLNPAIIAGGQMFFGLIPLLLVGIPLEGNPLHFHWTRMAIVSLLYLAIVGSVIAFLLYYWLVQNMDVTKTMLIALLTPVAAVVLGMVVLGEELSWRTIFGGSMIIGGIGLIVIARGRQQLDGIEAGA
ncbi:MAG: DMT family transporter [Pyrinomonadaceae bacterium]